MRTTMITLVVSLCIVGCQRQHSNYCPGVLNDNCLNLDAPVTGCLSDQECAPLVCDLTDSKMCVQCTASNPSACVGMTPVCSTDDTCRACSTHSECSSKACLPDGSCGTDATVAYVDPVGTGTSCTLSAPCTKVSDALKTGRQFVKFRGVTNEQVTLDNVNVTFLADPGATLTDTSNGILLRIDGASQVTIYDLTITGASGANNPGISLVQGNTATVSLTGATVSNNTGGGIVASGGTLTVSRSSFLSNAGGGISVMNGIFVVVGNVFFDNGGNSSFVGGISIGTAMNAANRLEFNTFVLNTARDTFGSGIQCVADTFTATSNIVSDNRNTTTTTQLDGTCTHAYSLVRPGTLPAGATNFGDDPKFVDEAMGDLHLQSGSLARGKADPAADLTGIATRDIDGTIRVSPTDVGAYVFSSSNASSPSRADGAP